MNLEERLQVLRQEHAKCKQQIAAFEAQTLRIEGAMALLGEMLAAPPKSLVSVPLSDRNKMAQPLIGISSPAGLNGMKMDWASVRTALFGTGMTASHMKDLSWNEAVTPTKPRGVHGIPLRRGLGFYTVTASATITLEAHAAMIAQLPNGKQVKNSAPSMKGTTARMS